MEINIKRSNYIVIYLFNSWIKKVFNCFIIKSQALDNEYRMTALLLYIEKGNFYAVHCGLGNIRKNIFFVLIIFRTICPTESKKTFRAASLSQHRPPCTRNT